MKTSNKVRTVTASQGKAPASGESTQGTRLAFGEFTLKISELNGWPVCAIYDGKKLEEAESEDDERKAFLLGFGVRKAKAIVACMAGIQRFVKLADLPEPKKK